MQGGDVVRDFFLTGSASGIGRHLTTQLLAQGHRVTASDIDLEGLSSVAAKEGWDKDRLRIVGLDVRDGVGWERALTAASETYGGLDVVMNIAGYLKPGYTHEFDPADIDRHFDINCKGVIHGTHAAAKLMVRQGRGHIINIASMAALAPIPGLPLYSASKYAVRAFSLAAAEELRPLGVAVTVVCPDAVATPMLDLQKDYAEAALTFSGSRVLTVQDIADVILGRILTKRPVEVAIPASRALLAKAANNFPG
ncbi:MAG: NADP-dependent 3-hydroxy acid dehydrogenase YdfG, partial [Myxococcota bacterium]